MNFSRVWIFSLLWLLPVAAMLLVHLYRQKRKAMERLADPHLMARLTGTARPGVPLFKSLLVLTAMLLVIVALAGPRWGSHYEEVSRKGVDIMLALDLSSSMRVKDMAPDRFERAKREISDLLRVMEGDRVGLVIFAGAAFVQCPLTLDYDAVHMFLNSLSPGMLKQQGTDIGAAIDASVNAFDFKAATDKVIVLFTDGEDNAGMGAKAAMSALSRGIKIFIFGMGTPEGGPIPSEAGEGFIKDSDGNVVISRLEEQSLMEIAASSGGVYVRADSGDMDLDRIYFEGVRERTEARELKGGKIKVMEERYYLFVLFAVLLLFVEGFVKERRRQRLS